MMTPSDSPLEQPGTTANYPPEWQTGEIQARIRQQADYTCEICGQRFDPATNKTIDKTGDTAIYGHVHHLDHQPSNCVPSNLIFVCQNCHIRLHGLDWKPGDQMPISWNNEPPPWVVRRSLPYRLNPAVDSLHEAARYLTNKQECARFIIQVIEQQGWVKGVYDPLAEMRAFLKMVLTEYEAVQKERTHEAQQPIVAAAQTWAAAHGFIAYTQAIDYAGLSKMDFDIAVEQGYINVEPCPYGDPFLPSYFDPRRLVLSEETRQELWFNMRLTRQQAADLLGLSVPMFERLRHKAGFQPAGTFRNEVGRYEPLYRKRDVEALRKR